MTRLRIAFVVMALLVVVLFQGASALTRQRELINRRRDEINAAGQRLAALHRESAALFNEVANAERQLADLPLLNIAKATADDSTRAPEIQAWLKNVRRLKQLFAERSDQRIPEMRLLTDEDWLRATHRIALDDEPSIRRTMAAIRTAAKNRFKAPLGQALSAYVKTANGVPPATIFALAPYFTQPADAESLSRFEIGDARSSSKMRAAGAPSWQIREKTAIDPDYDSRYYFNPNGSNGSSSGPTAWIPDFTERLKVASKAFAAANPAVAFPSIPQILPFFNPPLDPGAVEKLIKAERDNGH